MQAVGNLYELLGVSPTASQDDIRKAYRTAASRFHPDVNRSPAASLLFREMSAAHDILNDPTRRAEYDRSLNSHPTDRDLRLSTLLSRRVIARLDEPQLVYVMVTLVPPPGMATAGSGTPLNLALVIDRSTSMKGRRLDQVKAATNRVIDELADEDIVSVISFSDRAEVVLKATRPIDRRTMKAAVSIMRADGATAMYQGLRRGLQEMASNLHPRYINHLVLITDGHTYGDEEACLALADRAREQGVGISAMGIGEDWNDSFLDQLASRTGGSSEYVASHKAVSAFLEERIRSLGTAYAERASLVVAPSPAARLTSVFKVSPDPMPLDVDSHPIPLGILEAHAPTRLVLQFDVDTAASSDSELYLGRIVARADILGSQRSGLAAADVRVEVSEHPLEQNPPPPPLVDALSKLALYQLQERAQAALEQGNAVEASRRLELLATRLFERGEQELAQAAMNEAERVAATRVISDEGRKQIKYGTRALVSPRKGNGL